MGQSRPLFVYFHHFLVTISIIQIEKTQMVCLGFEPATTGWQAQMKPQSYGGRPSIQLLEVRHIICGHQMLGGTKYHLLSLHCGLDCFERAVPGLIFVYFRSFETIQIHNKHTIGKMVCLVIRHWNLNSRPLNYLTRAPTQLK